MFPIATMIFVLKCLLIGVLAGTINCAAHSVQIEVTSKTFTAFEQVDLDSQEGTTTEPSAISCAGRCVRDSQYTSVAFDETSGTCWLDPNRLVD